MSGRGTPAQQRQPGALIVGHVTEVLADQRGILQILKGGDLGVPPRAFGFADQAHAQVLQDVLFGGVGQAQRWQHAEKRSPQAKFVQFSLSSGSAPAVPVRLS
jgi:hypothetical protein